MTRLGSKLPFREAAEEVCYAHRLTVNESTVWHLTHRHGKAAEALARQEVEILDYAHFRRKGYPIGSGCVESGHKVMVQRRMKGAGMRWAEHHRDPTLALRNLVCNDRWEEGWQQVVLFQQELQTVRRIESADAKQPRENSR